MITSAVLPTEKRKKNIDYLKYQGSSVANRLNTLILLPRLISNPGEGYQFPLGIAYISASLKAGGFRVFTCNLNHSKHNLQTTLECLIKKHSIDIVATGGISVQYSSIFEIIKTAKHIKPSVLTIVGGGIITAEPDIAMDALEYADIGVIGEGEETICDLVFALETGISLNSVDGLIFKDDSRWKKTRFRQEITELDSIPWPDYAGFDLDKYLELPPPDVNNLGEERLGFILGSRSCPYSCTFCFHTVGRKYRKRSIENITAEVDYLVNKYDVRFLFMADELFGVDKTRVDEFCALMRKYNLPWRGSFRVDEINEDMVNTLKTGKCAIIGLGLESADDRILKSMRKKITIKQIENALKIIHDAEMPFSGNFIFGDIEETVETATNTFNWWLNHPQYNINLWMIVSYPGSHLYKHACDNGIITDRVEYLKKGCPAVNVSKLNNEEMNWLVRNIMEMPTKQASHVVSTSLISTNRQTNRITISGRCAACGVENLWPEIKPFISVNITCSNCSRKHNIPTPESIQIAIVNSIFNLVDSYGLVGIWGITYHSMEIFEAHDIFSDPRVILIDNSHSKQMMSIKGKKISDPHEINLLNIPAIIAFYPNSFQIIKSIIQANYNSVTEVIDVCDLMHQSR